MPRGGNRADLTDEEKQQAAEMYGEHSLNDIAVRFGCGIGKVKDALREHGVDLLSRGKRKAQEPVDKAMSYTESSINRGMTTTWRAAAREHYLAAGLPSVAALYPDPVVEVYDED